MKFYKTILFTFLFILNTFSNFAQTNENTTNLESALIDASKEQILGNYDKAISSLEAIRYEPKVKAVVNYQLAKLYKLQQKHDKALESISESVRLDPNNKWYIIYNANLLEEYGRFELTANSYVSLIKIEPNNYTFYDNASLNYLKASLDKKALKILDQAQTKFGIMPGIALRKASIFKAQTKDKKAIDILERALTLYPDHMEIYSPLIQLYARNKRMHDAEILSTRYIQKGGQNLHPENTKNRTVEKQLNDLNPNSALSLDEKIRSLVLKLNEFSASPTESQEAELIKNAQQLCANYPLENKSFALLGDTYFLIGKYREAISAYQKSILLNKVPYLVYGNLLYCLNATNQWLSLETTAYDVLEIYPNNAYPYYCYSNALYHQNKFTEAKSHINQSILMQKNPSINKTESLILKINILEALNLRDETLESLKMLESNPDDLSLGFLALHKCKTTNQIDLKSLQTLSKSKTLDSYTISFESAKIYMCTKDWNNAKIAINNALLEKTSQRPETLELAAEIYSQLGLKAEAKQYFTRALELSEIKENILKKINSLN